MVKTIAAFTITIAMLALVAPTNASATTYLFRTIDVPGATGLGTVAFGINDSGIVSGTYWVAVNGFLPGNQHGFLDNNGSLTTLDVPAPAHNTVVNGINNSDVIVGGYQTGSAPGLAELGFMYGGNTFTTINVPGVAQTSPWDINSSGSIAGFYFPSSSPPPSQFFSISHGFVYDGNTFTTIDVPGAVSTQLQGINDAGVVVGNYSNCSENSLTCLPHGFVYAGGQFTTLDVPGATTTNAGGINNSGVIVGDYENCVTVSLCAGHGFIYAGGIFTTIDVPGGIPGGTDIHGINNRGDIVGEYGTNFAPGGLSGFVGTSVQVLTGFPGGPPSNPVPLPGTSIYQLGASIGGQGSADFYEFFWSGGNFSADATVTGADALAEFEFELLDITGTIIAEEVLDALNNFSASIELMLGAGNYIIGILKIGPDDANFLITFNTPVDGPVTAAPEPGTLMLLASALGLLLCLSCSARKRQSGTLERPIVAVQGARGRCT
jgi:uncharacterized membrane protein